MAKAYIKGLAVETEECSWKSHTLVILAPRRSALRASHGYTANSMSELQKTLSEG